MRTKTLAWFIIASGAFVVIFSNRIVFPGLERIVGIETIVGAQNVVYQPDGSYLVTNPGAMLRWIASVAAIGMAISLCGVLLLLRTRKTPDTQHATARHTEIRRLKLMWDYQCWPLWENNGVIFKTFDPATFPLSESTLARLQAWAAIPDAKLAEHISAPQDMTWTEEEKRSFEAEGLELWRILRRELGSGFHISYHNPSAGPIRLPEADVLD